MKTEPEVPYYVSIPLGLFFVLFVVSASAFSTFEDTPSFEQLIPLAIGIGLICAGIGFVMWLISLSD